MLSLIVKRQQRKNIHGKGAKLSHERKGWEVFNTMDRVRA